ncbi:MAG: leucyl/phenylalanyl-tRNA--protein transferase [Sphingobacteriia bacterium]|nr:leucyl/phenylalanyl-tRNA--protein transferase [Sphingobacteriia bacterium]
MSVFELSDELVFPHPALADDDGLLAIGGDLSIERLLLAYANGIFPWYSADSPIMWWATNPRMVLFPDKFRVSHSLRQTLRSGKFKVTFDHDFRSVIQNCAAKERPDQEGTWITPEMQNAYINLHEAGYAHSVETWQDERLVGGLYGVSLGRVFFGESMFFSVRDASKVALATLTEKLKSWQFDMIDAQQETSHIQSLGGELIQLKVFLNILKKSLKHPTIKGLWC